MWINVKTKETFANRKEAKEKLGHYGFNRAQHNKILVFVPDNEQ